ncbi:Rz-like lysis system protein LysB [Halomonas janggokensis]|uniref:Rz-like lysis system protein LysB n=1 Tax=Vreelandella janggokensis TaxID=370767 RepID=UPI0022A79B3C|nr:Rz-like lysis system protein LysB [Halomonas janggokensis]MCZ0930290.1 Rz-like lysis system protein LysB [Halomonas janggokensis]
MNRLIAAVVILALVVTVTWALWQRLNAAEARAELAEQQLAESQQREAQHQVVIDALWANTQRLNSQRRDLARQQAALERTASHRLTTIEELQRDNATLRAWANSRLPDAISRLRRRPAVTGAEAYHQSVRDPQPLHPTGQPADD